MPKQDYTYAVARVRALENSLLNQDDINQLLACPDEDDAIEWLIAKGWGNGEDAKDAETILRYEYDKTWHLAKELVKNMDNLNVLFYQNFFNDIKGTMKRIATGIDAPEAFNDNPFLSDEEFLEIFNDRKWYRLQSELQEPTKEAFETLLETGDGQLADIMVDRMCLEAYRRMAQNADHQIIKDYAEEVVAVTNIKIAVRGARTKKNKEFFEMAMSECKTLSKAGLIKAALTGVESVIEYLETTDFKNGADSLKKSLSSFECWCDNRIVELMQPQKRNSFTIGPVFAYLYARENELKSVRNILMGKRSNLDVDNIRERVRMMYV